MIKTSNASEEAPEQLTKSYALLASPSFSSDARTNSCAREDILRKTSDVVCGGFSLAFLADIVKEECDRFSANGFGGTRERLGVAGWAKVGCVSCVIGDVAIPLTITASSCCEEGPSPSPSAVFAGE